MGGYANKGFGEDLHSFERDNNAEFTGRDERTAHSTLTS